jgi:hypothetical protein
MDQGKLIESTMLSAFHKCCQQNYFSKSPHLDFWCSSEKRKENIHFLIFVLNILDMYIIYLTETSHISKRPACDFKSDGWWFISCFIIN